MTEPKGKDGQGQGQGQGAAGGAGDGGQGQGAGGAGGQGGGQGGDGGQGQGGGIEATVRRILAEMLPKGRGAASEHDVTAQVEAAVAKVHQGQQAQQVIADLQARLKAVEEKKVPEAKPKEYRKITMRMWGSDDD